MFVSEGVDSGLPPIKFPPLKPTFENHTYTVTEVLDELSPGYFVIPVVAVLANVAIAKAFSKYWKNITQFNIALTGFSCSHSH